MVCLICSDCGREVDKLVDTRCRACYESDDGRSGDEWWDDREQRQTDDELRREWEDRELRERGAM